jgi:hypothetical protein
MTTARVGQVVRCDWVVGFERLNPPYFDWLSMYLTLSLEGREECLSRLWIGLVNCRLWISIVVGCALS